MVARDSKDIFDIVDDLICCIPSINTTFQLVDQTARIPHKFF